MFPLTLKLVILLKVMHRPRIFSGPLVKIHTKVNTNIDVLCNKQKTDMNVLPSYLSVP